MYTIRPANFLEHYRPATPQKKPWFFFIVLVAIVAVGIGAVFSARSLMRIVEKTQRAKDYLLYSAMLVQDQQFADARKNIQRGRALLSGVSEDLRSWRVLSPFPLVGRQFTAFVETVVTVDRLAVAFDRVVLFAEDVVTTAVGNQPLNVSAITPAQKRLLLAKFFEAAPMLQVLKTDIDFAILSLNKIPDGFLLPPLAKAVQPLKEKIPRLQRTLTVALPLVEALPLVSGYPEEQTYLFLFQNNDELRPTGGFIGTYGLLVLRDGEIKSLFTDNVYRLDRLAEREKRLRVTPPDPIARHLNVRRWFLRDVNWSPDFPTTARQALTFYEKESADHGAIDGVIAVTPTVLVRFLRLLGPLTIGEVQFTPENVVDVLQYHVEKGYEDVGLPDIERKEIIGRMTKELVQRVLTMPLERVPDLLDVIEASLRERHILFYETNPELQKLVVQEGWGGGVRQSDGDYFMVVDANLAALKTDSVMERSVSYAVVPADRGRLKATLSVTYYNSGLFSWKTTRYRTYTRAYVPKGAELLRSDGFITEDRKREPKRAEISEDLRKTVFGGYLIIEPRETKTVTLEYLLPPSVVRDGAYTLYAQKQSGTEGHPLRVALQFDKKITGWQPTGFTVERKGGTLTFPTDLRVDRQFRVEF